MLCIDMAIRNTAGQQKIGKRKASSAITSSSMMDRQIFDP
jgi:hypothetical protein